MSKQEQKVVQYLSEAHGAELGLMRELQAQIAMTPRGSHRDGLEAHLRETCRHAERLEARLGELRPGGGPLQVGLGAVQALVGQAVALTKTPFNLVRGTGGDEKVLKNAKDSCAAEALEIATYTALARLARAAGDETTERLANSILEDEQRMLERLVKQIPRLTDAVARAEFDGRGSYELGETGAADALREVGETTERGARRGTAKAKRAARPARKVPGVARAEGTVKGAVASAADLAIPNYDSLSAGELRDRLAGLSQVELAKVAAYERRNQNRSGVRGRIESLQAAEPWPGYDELTADEVRAVLSEGDEQRLNAVRAYERRHKARAGVLQATERELSNA